MKRKHRRAIVITASVVAGVAILAIAAAAYLEWRAGDLLEREFTKMTHGRYRLTTSDVDIDLFRRSVTLDDVVIVPDSAVVAADASKSKKRVVDGFSARQVVAAGLHFNNKKDKKLRIRKLIVTSPKLSYRETPSAPAAGDNATGGSNGLKVEIGQLLLTDGALEGNRLSHSDTLRNMVEGIRIEAGGLAYDNTRPGGGQRDNFTLTGGLTLSVARITHLTEDRSTRYEVDSISLDTKTGLLRIRRAEMVPTYDKEDFAHKSWRHADWTELSMRDLTLSGIDFDHLLAQRELLADSLLVRYAHVASYKNRQIEREEWLKPMYHTQIHRLPVKFAVMVAALESGDARYEELAQGGESPGVLTFTKLSGGAEYLSNISKPETPYTKLWAEGVMLDAATLSATFYLPVDSLADRFEVMGIVGPFPLTALNPMIKPLANVELESGRAKKLDFHIVGNSAQARIDLTFRYDNLSVTILKQKNDRVKERKLLTTIVNDIVLKHNNDAPGDKSSVHAGSERDPYRSPFNYLWKTIFAGLKEVVGL